MFQRLIFLRGSAPARYDVQCELFHFVSDGSFAHADWRLKTVGEHNSLSLFARTVELHGGGCVLFHTANRRVEMNNGCL